MLSDDSSCFKGAGEALEVDGMKNGVDTCLDLYCWLRPICLAV